MTLDLLIPGSSCTIIGLSATNMLGQRLLDMGIFSGLTLRVIRNAPPGRSHAGGDREDATHKGKPCSKDAVISIKAADMKKAIHTKLILLTKKHTRKKEKK